MAWPNVLANLLVSLCAAWIMYHNMKYRAILSEINEHQYVLVNAHDLCEYDKTHTSVCSDLWQEWIEERYPRALQPLAYGLMYLRDPPIPIDVCKFKVLNATIDYYSANQESLLLGSVGVPKGASVQQAISVLMKEGLQGNEAHSPIFVQPHTRRVGKLGYYLYTAMQFGDFDTDGIQKPMEGEQWLSLTALREGTLDGPVVGMCGVSTVGMICVGLQYDEPFGEPECVCTV